jgi:hypothetical protein
LLSLFAVDSVSPILSREQSFWRIRRKPHAADSYKLLETAHQSNGGNRVDGSKIDMGVTGISARWPEQKHARHGTKDGQAVDNPAQPRKAITQKDMEAHGVRWIGHGDGSGSALEDGIIRIAFSRAASPSEAIEPSLSAHNPMTPKTSQGAKPTPDQELFLMPERPGRTQVSCGNLQRTKHD